MVAGLIITNLFDYNFSSDYKIITLLYDFNHWIESEKLRTLKWDRPEPAFLGGGIYTFEMLQFN